MNDDYLLCQLASEELFLDLLPCQTWKQEWNHLELTLVDYYCSSAFVYITVTPTLKVSKWWVQILSRDVRRKQMGLKIASATTWCIGNHQCSVTVLQEHIKKMKKVFIVLCSASLRTRPPGLNVSWENTSSSLKALRSSRIGCVKLRGSLTPASLPLLTRAL